MKFTVLSAVRHANERQNWIPLHGCNPVYGKRTFCSAVKHLYQTAFGTNIKMEGTEMKQRVRHLLSVLLVCAMVLSLLPISVLAEELETPLTTVTEPANVPKVEGEPKEEFEPEPQPATIIYVKQGENGPVLAKDDTGTGSNDNPYASLAKAVEVINSNKAEKTSLLMYNPILPPSSAPGLRTRM